MASFESLLKKKFDERQLARHDFLLLGCKIDQLPDNSISVTQLAKSDSIDVAYLQTDLTGRRDLPATDADTQAFWRVLGQMLYIGQNTSLVFLHHASAMARKTFYLPLRHLKQLQSILSRTKTSSPSPSFKFTPTNSKSPLMAIAMQPSVNDPQTHMMDGSAS